MEKIELFACSCCSTAFCENPDLVAQTSDKPQFAPDVVPGDTSSTATVAIGSSVDGVIDTLGDHDWYRVTLVAGQTYAFTIGATGTGDILDSYLRLRNNLGTLIAEDDDSGPAAYSRLVFTATTSGTYFLDVGTFGEDEIGNFRVAAALDTPLPPDAVPGDASTTVALAIGSNINGITNTNGDHDWYRLSLVAGETYVIRTNATGGANDVDTFINIRDAAGAVLVSNDDGGGGTYSAVRFTATTTGTYYVDVGAFDDLGTGAFNVSAAIAPPLAVFTNDQIANQLVNTYWGAGGSRHFNVAPGGTITVNITGLTAPVQVLAQEAFNLWSDVTGIIFNQVATGGQIVVDDTEVGAFASSVRSGGFITSSSVNVGTAWTTTYGTSLNSYSFQTFIHEIGHALGLGHGGNYNGNANYATDASYLNDSWATTIMSYFDQTENSYFAGLNFTKQFVVSPIVADIVATTQLYGTATTTRTGDTQYGFGNTSGRVIYDATQFASVTYTVVDHGGIDTLDYSGFSVAQRINLAPESFSSVGGRTGNVTIARGTIIENVVGGSGADTIFGNDQNNVLTGNAGADILFGNAGNDDLNGGDGNDTIIGGVGNDKLTGGLGTNELIGGAGDDIYVIANIGDSIVELVGEGNDIIQTALAVYVMTAGNVEGLVSTGATNFLGIGNALGNNITGNNGSVDDLYGRDGDDILNGGTGANNTLIGGLGDDLYLVGSVGDSTIELPGEGTDEVRTTFTLYGLQANVENLTFTDNGTHAAGVGNDIANILTGGTGVDDLFGRAGNDTLIGGSGSANTLLGQEGDDLYIVTAVGDSVVEFLNEGFDTVQTALASFTLGNNVESLIYTGAATFTGIGGVDGNTMIAGAGADFLSGLGGNDVLTGGGGADTLLGGDGADQFRYVGNDGIDTIVGFTAGVDKIALSSAFFTPTATVSFVLGSVATTANSTFLYDPTTGIVSYDDDGNGAGAAVALASVGAGLTLGAGDFIFF